jgi:hypothetical protein
MNINEVMAGENPEALFADGFEDAIIGIARRFSLPPLVAYDYNKCIEILVDDGMTAEEAMEYFEFNVQGSWMGEGTPIFIEEKNG